MTIDLPMAATVPSKGKFGSEKTFRSSPISMGPSRAEMSPTWQRRGKSGPHSCR